MATIAPPGADPARESASGLTNERESASGLTNERESASGLTNERESASGLTNERESASGLTNERESASGLTNERKLPTGAANAPRGHSLLQPTLVFVALLIVISAWAFRSMLFALPQGIQAWPQADRYSVTLGFYDRGMNLFVPTMHNIQGNPRGVTPSEFPLIGYLAAALGFVFGRDSISLLNRLLTLLVSSLGIIVLFRFALRRTGDPLLASIVGIFVFVSPVYLFFAGTYLHDTAACSLILLALIDFFDRREDQTPRALARATPILLLATLIKASSGIYLIALWVVGLVRLSRSRSSRTRKEWLTLGVIGTASLALLVAYGLQLRWLSRQGVSAFSYGVVPRISSLDDLSLVLRYLYSNWVPEYLTVVQVGIFCAAIVPASVLWLDRPETRDRLRLGTLALIAAGGLAFFLLFAKRFIDHEYYAIVPLYPLLALALATSVETLSPLLARRRTRPLWGALLAALVLVSLYHHGQRVRDERLDHPFAVKKLAWMRGGDAVLDRLGVPRSSCITVLGEEAFNLALVYFDRRGVIIPLRRALRSKDAVRLSVQRYQCPTLVVRRRVAQLFARVHPSTLNGWKQLGSTRSVLVFRVPTR